jgi:hypothetical protein
MVKCCGISLRRNVVVVFCPDVSPSETPNRLPDAELAALLDEPMALEDRDDLPTLVPALPAIAFLTIARRLRDESRLDLLLGHATPDQITSLFDLDAWTGDRIDVIRARKWLDLVVTERQGLDLPRGHLTELMFSTDPEMWTFALHHLTSIFTIDLENDSSRSEILDSLGDLCPYESPDGFFIVAVPDDEFGREALRVIDSVYADDLNQGRKLLLSLQSALGAMMEEDLLRWRQARLADLGFPSWEESMNLLRPLRLDELARASESMRFVPEHIDPLLIPATESNDWIARVMERLDPNEHGIRTREFMLLANELLIAQRLEPGDELAQRRAVQQAQATLSVAFERIANHERHPDPIGLCADFVRRFGLRRIFRVGYDAIWKLRKAALALHKSGPISYRSIGSYLDRPWGPVIASLSKWIPELPVTTSENRTQRNQRPLALTQPIRSLAELAHATELLGQAHALVVLAYSPNGLNLDPRWNTRVDDPNQLRIGDLIRSALILRQLRPQAEFRPLDANDLARAQKEHCANGRLDEVVSRDFQELCQQADVAAHFAALRDAIVTRLEYELAAIEYDASGTVRLDRIAGFVTVRNASIWLNTGLSALEREEKHLGSSEIEEDSN